MEDKLRENKKDRIPIEKKKQQNKNTQHINQTNASLYYLYTKLNFQYTKVYKTKSF